MIKMTAYFATLILGLAFWISAINFIIRLLR
jgi:hypothetical protein